MRGKSDGFLEFFNAQIVGSSAIIAIDARLAEETINEHLYWIPTTLSSKWVLEKRFDPRIVDERVKALSYYVEKMCKRSLQGNYELQLANDVLYIDLTHPFGWYAFGHLHDSLQRLFNVQDIVGNCRQKIIYLV